MNDQSQRYAIEAELGRGASATVYRARDMVLGRVVALKVMDAALTADPSYMTRFIREAQLAARLDHPNIVAVHDAGALPGGEPFIAMRFVEGVTLAELIATQGPLAPALVADIVRQVAAALDEMHANDLVHRDLKPANVMIDAVGRVLVADLGIAVAADLDSVTQTGMIIGTPMYMAPEQVRGERATPAVDIYALGVIAFELLTGSPPFRGSGTSLMYHIVHSPPPSLAETGVAAPAELEQVIGRAMAKEPANRWSTAGALAAAMAGSSDATQAAPIVSPALATLAQRTTPTTAPAWPEPTPTTARSRRFDTVIRERPKRTAAWASAIVALGAIFGVGSQCLSGDESGSVSPPGVSARDDATPTATATATATEVEPTPDPEATGVAIEAGSATPTGTVEASATAADTPAPTATQTPAPPPPTATLPPVPTPTSPPPPPPPPPPTATPTPHPTATPTATATPHPTATPTPSPTPALPPTAPSNVQAESGFDGVIVSWTDNSHNENGFIIYFMAENLNDADNPYFAELGQAGPDATSTEVSPPILPAIFAGGSWGVAAYNDSGASAITWE